MSRILYVWELGAGYGHIAAFHAVAQWLKRRGHQVIFVLKNLEYADSLLGKDGFDYLQAPIRWPGMQTMPPAISYPGILKNAGFNDEAGLFGRTLAWLSLYRYLQPDLIVFDHAPTALLAARMLSIPKVLFGNGFFSPPRLSPMPGLHPMLKVPEKELIKTEAEVLRAANSVLQRLNCPTLGMLADLFGVDEDFLLTFPELDHYPQRSNACHWGPALYQSEGLEPRWPSVGGGKIFAYVRTDYANLETLLQQLRATACSVLIHIPGVTPAFIQKHNSANLHISPHPYKISDICQQCDLAICHGGVSTLSSFLLSGKPVLVLPMQLEQWLSALKVEALGFGKCIASETKKPNYRAAISELLSDFACKQAAGALAEKYAEFSPARQANDIGLRCEALIDSSRAGESSKVYGATEAP